MLHVIGGIAVSARTQMLKKATHVKSTKIRRFKTSPVFNSPVVGELEFRQGTKICLERARLVTESWKATEGDNIAVRRAKATAHILDNVTIYIRDGELIVGNFASDPYSLPLHPDLDEDWIPDALAYYLKDLLTDSEKVECREIFRYWRGKSIADHIVEAIPGDLKSYLTYNGFFYGWGNRLGRAAETPNLEELFSVGINGIIERIGDRLKRLDAEIDELDAADYVRQKQNLQAMIIALKAVIKFGKRYAEKSRELAKTEKDEKRKKELERIAEVCDWVPGNPPRTLWEALQASFFINLIAMQLEFHGQGFGNRLDVLFNPFYQRDKEAGRITREEAQELVECFLIKLSERGHLVHPNAVAATSGNSDWTDVTICGVTPEGDDATNEFSFIVLDAAKSVRVPVPTIALRYHHKISEDIILKAIDLLRTGVGYPAFFNDAAAIPWLISRELSLEEARKWVCPSCVNAQVPGKATRTYQAQVGCVNLSKCIELALYQGKDKDAYTGKQLGAKTPDPTTFTSFDDVIDAYLTQVRFVADKLAKMTNITYAVAKDYCRRPFASAFVDGCIEEGEDCVSLGRGSITSINVTGTTNVADSLAVIKKLVFDEKTVTIKELVEACASNWDKKEELRQRCINEVPKFGSDDEYVDRLAREVHVKTNAEFMKFNDYFGYPMVMNGSVAGGYYGYSKACGATPDGRKDSESLADAVCSPMAGRDKRGPTAVLKSVSKITPTYNHLLNQKFLPQFLEGENSKIFAYYLKTWADLGIYHIQFNVIDKATLLDAKAHPEKYFDLVVRVAGYSAYWVDLDKGLQNEIIKRTEQGFN